MNKGILLDDDNDLKAANGELVIGDCLTQDAYMILSMNQGDLKEDPLAGVSLTRMIRGRENPERIRKTIEIALERIGIRFEEIREQVAIIVNNNQAWQ